VPKRVKKTGNAPILFAFDENNKLDRAAYNDLPEWLRNILAKSVEYKEASAPELAKGTTDERLKVRLRGEEETAETWPGNVPEPPASEEVVETWQGKASVQEASSELSASSAVREPSEQPAVAEPPKQTPPKVKLRRPKKPASPTSTAVEEDLDDAIPFIVSNPTAEPIPVLRKKIIA
jgi:hypothetical protein